MTMAMKLLCRVIRRRLSAGERWETILMDYPKLTQSEQAQIRAEFPAQSN